MNRKLMAAIVAVGLAGGVTASHAIAEEPIGPSVIKNLQEIAEAITENGGIATIGVSIGIAGSAEDNNWICADALQNARIAIAKILSYKMDCLQRDLCPEGVPLPARLARSESEIFTTPPENIDPMKEVTFPSPLQALTANMADAPDNQMYAFFDLLRLILIGDSVFSMEAQPEHIQMQTQGTELTAYVLVEYPPSLVLSAIIFLGKLYPGELEIFEKSVAKVELAEKIKKYTQYKAKESRTGATPESRQPEGVNE